MLQKNLPTGVDNYIRLGNIHIFIGMNDHTLGIIRGIRKVANQNVHIFLTSPDNIGSELDEIVTIVAMYMDDARLTIHVPKFIRDVKTLAVNAFKKYPYCKIVGESRGPSFRIPGMNKMLDIVYTKKGITASVRLYSSQYSGYKVHGCDPNSRDPMEHGAVNSIPRLKNPDMFKNEIIKSFKKSCPDGILSSFKSDDDIWDYIMMNGEWSVVNEKEDNDV